MDRAEQAGLGLSVAGHVAVFAALSLGLFVATKPIAPKPTPIDIEIVDKVGPADAAPKPIMTEPAPSIAPELGPPEETPPVEVPVPETRALSPPQPKRAPPPQPVLAKPAPRKAVPALPKALPAKVSPKPAVAAKAPHGSRLGSDFLKGIADRPTASTAQAPRAAAGPAVEASLAREVLRQLKPFWHAPTGADAELLRTELSISLARDGSVVDVRAIGTKGVTDSNGGQVRLHQEAAIKAVKLAAPFTLPAEFYETWKLLEPVGFDKRLSQ